MSFSVIIRLYIKLILLYVILSYLFPEFVDNFNLCCVEVAFYPCLAFS